MSIYQDILFCPLPPNHLLGAPHYIYANSIKSKVRDDLSSSLYLANFIESTFAELAPENQTNVIVGCIYKHPSFSIDEFNTVYVTPLLNKISKEGKNIILMGDFNINLLNENTDKSISEFLDLMGTHLLLPSISLPTRVTVTSQTLIDNIFISPSYCEASSGNLTIGISDHLPQFLILNSSLHEKSETKDSYYRDWNSFDREHFILDFLSYDWDKELKIEEKDPNVSFNIFYEN